MSNNERIGNGDDLQGDFTFEAETARALSELPQHRGARTNRKSRHLTNLISQQERIVSAITGLITDRQISINKFQAALDGLDEDANRQSCESQLKDAEKKPTSISLVKAFLSCDPDTRSPKQFGEVISLALENQALRIKYLRGSAQDLKAALDDAWFGHCVRAGNEHLEASAQHARSMGFIEMLLKTPRFARMKVSLPLSAQREAASQARPSCDA
jgi:hypothetical protein